MTQAKLFPDDRHDAGGKVSTRLPSDIRGDAMFTGDRDRYRPILRRWSGSIAFPDRFVLFIGMNPSTASDTHNDPTITREWGFTIREGFSAFAKCNVSDYRATKPAELLESGLELQSADNRATIIEQAKLAALVIVCWGAVNRALEPLAASLTGDLRSAGIDPRCFGTTKAGHPRHPLYLASGVPLVSFFS